MTSPAQTPSSAPTRLVDRLKARMPEPVRRRWPHIRAAFILFHVVAVLLLGFPAPAGVMSRSAWKEPSVQNEMRIWTQRINAVGVKMTQQEFEDLLWNLSDSFLSVRNRVLRPFKPYADYLGVRQDWRMFSAPHRYPVRLHVDVYRQGRWETVFVSRSDEYDWNRYTMDHHRMRRIVFLHAWKKYDKRYGTFAKWIAWQIEQDFPDAERVRVRQYKYRTPEPEEARNGKLTLEGKYINQRVIPLPLPNEPPKAPPPPKRTEPPSTKAPASQDPAPKAPAPKAPAPKDPASKEPPPAAPAPQAPPTRDPSSTNPEAK